MAVGEGGKIMKKKIISTKQSDYKFHMKFTIF